MPRRRVILATDETYHIFNRGISHQRTFITKRDYQRAIDTFKYYQYRNIPIRFSSFLDLPREEQRKILTQLTQKEKLVAIIAFCLMPNHFHFILKQNYENGISSFIGKFTNSYTRYFNTKNNRHGPLFQGRFKAVCVESEAQLLHLSRYIHLNPHSSFLIKDFQKLENYPYSSFREYLGKSKNGICEKEDILSQFKQGKSYRQFVFEQADYQQTISIIKHIVLEEPE